MSGFQFLLLAIFIAIPFLMVVIAVSRDEAERKKIYREGDDAK
jgi:hypothetical protein